MTLKDTEKFMPSKTKRNGNAGRGFAPRSVRLRQCAPDMLNVGERCKASDGMLVSPWQTMIEGFDGKKWRIVNKAHRTLERVA